MKKLFNLTKAFVLLTIILFGVIGSLSAASNGVATVTLISPNASETSFSSIQAAYNAVDFVSTAGAYTIVVSSTYDPTAETFPIVLGAKASASEINTVTIRPAAGVSQILSSATSKIVVFDGAKFVTIDGRPVGSNSAKGFTFTNLSIAATASTIEFVNDAYKNNLKYCTVLGAQVAIQSGAPAPITSGNIVIGTTTGTVARGGDATAGFSGSGNLYNTIDNCDIADASTGTPTAGVCMIGTAIYTNEGNVISNCNIYNCFNPNYNYSAAVFVGANSQSSVITYNKIYQTVARTFFTYGIHTPIHVNSATKEISFNTIGYAKNDGTGTYTIGGAQSHKFQGMKLTGTVTTLKGNVISDVAISSTSVGAANIGVVCGIFNEGANFPVGDVNAPNIIRNITLNASGTLAAAATFSMAGISTTSWTGGNIQYTTIDNLKVNPTGTNALTNKGILYGIYAIQSWGANVKQNRISNLIVGATGSTGAHVITGISATPQGNQGVTCERNLIYNLNAVSAVGAIVTGIFTNGGTGTSVVKNNVVAIGNDMVSPAEIRGIYKSSVGADKLYHNSIYIGGATAGTTANTYAYYRNSTTPTVAGEVIANNIFVNKRIGGTTGSHYALKMKNVEDYSGGFIASTYNLFDIAADLSSKLANIGADVADFATLASLYPSFATGCKSGDAMFVDATAATPDMHVSSNSPANGTGVVIAGVTDDFAGAVRADFTPVDMGAYSISGTTPAVVTTQERSLSVNATANALVFYRLSGSAARIYSSAGQMVKSISLTSDNVSVPMAKGFYIVVVGDCQRKVLVK